MSHVKYMFAFIVIRTEIKFCESNCLGANRALSKTTRLFLFVALLALLESLTYP